MKDNNIIPIEAKIKIQSSIARQDCLFLCFVGLLSLIFYIGRLGFYSDDWAFLGYLSTSDDQSFSKLTQVLLDNPNIKSRPAQAPFQAGLYWLFGLHPLGYHLVNAGVFLSGILLFYLVLRELNQVRILTLTIPLVYGLLPHYSTVRFWYAAFIVTLSMTLYFLSLYANLRMLREKETHWWRWKLISILSLIGSALNYEIFLPLFFFNLLLLWYRSRKLYGWTPNKQLFQANWLKLYGIDVFIILLVGMFKALTASRMGTLGFISHSIWFAKTVVKATKISYGDYGIGLLGVTFKILHNYPNRLIIGLGIIVSLVIFSYVYWTTHQSKEDLTDRASLIKLVGWGIVIFGLGYGIFLTNLNILITPTGLSNRINLASAVGVAISFVGGIGWVSTFITSAQIRRRCFCLLIALLCASGFVINNILASFWIDSYHQQQEILTDIKQRFPTLPTESTLILDGICPYAGPAVVFESNWDLAGTLMVFYGDRTLHADVVTPDFKVKANGLSTTIYGSNHYYPYNKKLFVYDFNRKTTHYLTDFQTAQQYFKTFNPDYNNDCPIGEEGFGVAVF